MLVDTQITRPKAGAQQLQAGERSPLLGFVTNDCCEIGLQSRDLATSFQLGG